MQRPKTYRSSPVYVTAMRFLGWQNALKINKWTGCAFYVPRGYENEHRTDNEKDGSNGNTLDTAAEFLIVDVEGAEACRVNVGDWLVKGDDGRLFLFGDKLFFSMYTEET